MKQFMFWCNGSGNITFSGDNFDVVAFTNDQQWFYICTTEFSTDIVVSYERYLKMLN